jgi:hypothetical protein
VPLGRRSQTRPSPVLSRQAKSQLQALSDQLGGLLGEKLSIVGAEIGERASEALRPYSPYIDELAGQASDKAAVVRDFTGKVTSEVLKDNQVRDSTSRFGRLSGLST